MPGTPGNCMSGPGAGSAWTTSASLPIARRAYAIASDDPIESPSGREWEEIRNRWRERMASTICSSSPFVVIVGGAGRMDFVEELFDTILPGDRLVVGERQLGHTLQTEARTDL